MEIVSIAKFIVDAEQCAMGYRMAEELKWDDFDEALAAVRDIGPGGHYLGHSHTQERFKGLFMPKLFDNNVNNGLLMASRTPRPALKTLLICCRYQQPDLDPGINEALLEYIARREREIPAMDALNPTKLFKPKCLAGS